MNVRAKILSTLLSTVFLWIAIGVVLVYDHNTTAANPNLTAIQRHKHQVDLYAIAATFVVFNAGMSILRIGQIQRQAERSGLS